MTGHHGAGLAEKPHELGDVVDQAKGDLAALVGIAVGERQGLDMGEQAAANGGGQTLAHPRVQRLLDAGGDRPADADQAGSAGERYHQRRVRASNEDGRQPVRKRLAAEHAVDQEFQGPGCRQHGGGAEQAAGIGPDEKPAMPPKLGQKPRQDLSACRRDASLRHRGPVPAAAHRRG